MTNITNTAKNIMNSTGYALDKVTKFVNDETQIGTQACHALHDEKRTDTYIGGRLLDNGAHYGAGVALALTHCAKWVVGRGIEPGEKAIHAPRRLALQQHGAVGYALRQTLQKLCDLSGVGSASNLGLRLADAALGVVRLFTLSWAQSICVTLFFYPALIAQFMLNAGYTLYTLGHSAFSKFNFSNSASSEANSFDSSSSNSSGSGSNIYVSDIDIRA